VADNRPNGGAVPDHDQTATDTAATRQQALASAAALRTLTFSAALLVVCGLLLGFSDLLEPLRGQPMLQWWAIAPIAVLAQLLVFAVEFRRETYTFTFSEIPLVLGLFLADPVSLIVGRLAGELIFLVVKERQAPRKVILNLSAFLAETTVLLAVARVLGVSADVNSPRNWAIALVAVAAGDLCGYAIVHRVLHWHGEQVRFTAIVGLGGVIIPANVSFALLIGILLDSRPWASLLLISIGAFLMMSYRSYSTLRQRFDSLSLLYDFTRLVSGAKRPNAVLEAILGQAKDLMRAERAEIWLSDGTGVLALSVDDSGQTSRELPQAAGDLASAWFEKRPGTTIVDVGVDQPDDEVLSLATMLNARDAIVSPVTESGVTVGLVAVIDRLGEVKRFAEPDRMMFATLANHASVALENGRLIDRLHQEAKTREHEALHDALTGLPNRTLFAERLSQALNTGRVPSLAVGLLDLDGFKEINDTLGHQTGDIVLVEVARRLRATVPDDVLVARLGGDEFALMFQDVTSRTAVEAAARSLCEAISAPLSLDHMSVNVSGSIGLTLALVGADPATLLQRADVAMYSAKAGHGAGVAFYDALRDENSPRRLRLATDLRSAVGTSDMRLAMQPKVTMATGEITGMEALSRWYHPELGEVPPDEFIPIAERTGCIRELTHAVLRQSAIEALVWHAQGLDWTISVNIAVRNLLDDSFVDTVAEVLRSTGCRPSLLMLEITETGAMFDAAKAVATLDRLADLGVQISVDDFGTGYSSLSYLQRLPASEVKIDKAFVQELHTDERANAIVRTILDLARNLGLHVVAEGVETEDMWNRLRELGCELAQGFYVARPMPADDVLAWAARWNSSAHRRLLPA
jgi:diguanylate cyclase (GGDEF)-like protein